ADALTSTLRRFTPPPATRPSAAQAAATDVASQPPPSDPLPANPNAAQAVPRGSYDPHHPLRNRDLDTGTIAHPGTYRLTDATYCKLAHRLVQKPTQPIPPGIKDDILAFYGDLR